MCMPQLVIFTFPYNILNSSYTVAKTSIGVKLVAPIVTIQKIYTSKFLTAGGILNAGNLSSFAVIDLSSHRKFITVMLIST